MLPEAYVVHTARTRLRVRIPCKRGVSSYFSMLQEVFEAQSIVKSVSVNPRTGGALLITEADVGTIADIAVQHEVFALSSRHRRRNTLIDRISDSVKATNGRLMRFTGGELDLASAVFLFMLVSGVYQVMRGNLTAPAWYAAFYYAHHFFTRIHAGETGEHANGEAGPGGDEY